MIENLESTSESNAWWYLPSFAEFLKKSRLENISVNYSMNISIILHSATIIEGFINELLSERIGTNINNNTLEDRLNHELNLRIDKSSWGDLQYLYQLIFGNNLEKDIDNCTWKGINSLFDLRNMLTHGKIMRLNVFEENGVRKAKMSGKYQKVYNYLANEKKVIPKVNIKLVFPNVELITNESANLYWDLTKIFIKQIYEKHKNNLEMICNSYDIAFEYKE